MKKAFTLVELIAVVVIIGILATIAIPQYANLKERSYGAEAWVNLGMLLNGEKAYYLDHDSWEYNINSLPVDNPNSSSSRRFNYACGNAGYLYCRATGIASQGTSWQYEIECSGCGSAGEFIKRYEKPPGGDWQEVH